jgi:hypothetical protein
MKATPIPTLIRNASKHQDRVNEQALMIQETMQSMKGFLHQQHPKEAARMLLSMHNYIQRCSLDTHHTHDVMAGDVVYVDFGQAYLNEAGYQHLGLVLATFNGKIFVVPMSSNPDTYHMAFDADDNPHGRHHLMRFGQRCGLNRPSVLFLNDCKFINPNRIIDFIGFLDTTEPLFTHIQQRVFACLFQDKLP